VRILYRGFGAKEISPCSEPAVIDYKSRPLFSSGPLHLNILALGTVIRLTFDEREDIVDVNRDKVWVVFVPLIKFDEGFIATQPKPPVDLRLLSEP
jgi:hypothetical protein